MKKQATVFSYFNPKKPPANLLHETPSSPEGTHAIMPPVNTGLQTRVNRNTVALSQWYYPQNIRNLRNYQFKVIKTLLTHNTFLLASHSVAKSFYGSVVLYNYYKWFPTGKILVLSPTEERCSIQIEIYRQQLLDIHRNNFRQINEGFTQIQKQKNYSKYRVYFMTPEAFLRDQRAGMINVAQVVLVVIDEAHRWLDNSGYSDVMDAIREEKIGFRVLALTATRVFNGECVQKVIKHLNITKLKSWFDIDCDQLTYIKNSSMEILKVKPQNIETLLKQAVSQAMIFLLDPLYKFKIISNEMYRNDPLKLTLDIVGSFISKLRFDAEAIEAEWGPDNAVKSEQRLCSIQNILTAMNEYQTKGILAMDTYIEAIKLSAKRRRKFNKEVLESYVSSKEFRELEKVVGEWYDMPIDGGKFEVLLEILTMHWAERTLILTEYECNALRLQQKLAGHDIGDTALTRARKFENPRVADASVVLSNNKPEHFSQTSTFDVIILYDWSITSVAKAQNLGNKRVVCLVNELNPRTSLMSTFQDKKQYVLYKFNSRMIPDTIYRLELQKPSKSPYRESTGSSTSNSATESEGIPSQVMEMLKSRNLPGPRTPAQSEAGETTWEETIPDDILQTLVNPTPRTPAKTEHGETTWEETIPDDILQTLLNQTPWTPAKTEHGETTWEEIIPDDILQTLGNPTLQTPGKTEDGVAAREQPIPDYILQTLNNPISRASAKSANGETTCEETIPDDILQALDNPTPQTPARTEDGETTWEETIPDDILQTLNNLSPVSELGSTRQRAKSPSPLKKLKR